MTSIHFDYEGYGVVDLKKVGLDVYSAHPETEVTMCALAFDDDEPELWEPDATLWGTPKPFPREWRMALLSKDVEKWAFNAQFERVITRRVMKIATPYEGWRCAMVLGHMQSFVGDLEQMGERAGISPDKLKMKEGKRLMRMFAMPQKLTAKQQVERFTKETHPEEWEMFGAYCLQDVVAERALKRRLIKYPNGLSIPDERIKEAVRREWRLYEIDQIINDRGIPVDQDFVNNAITMSAKRKAELTSELKKVLDANDPTYRDKTGKVCKISNPNSRDQFLGWLRENDYPWRDLKKDTVKKCLTENAEAAGGAIEYLDADTFEMDESIQGFLPMHTVKALMLRQQVARTATTKYTQLANSVGRGKRFRFGFQFGGAARTNRWAGRRLNPQNLARPPSVLNITKAAVAMGVRPDKLLDIATDMIREGDVDGLWMLVNEPLNILAGIIRSTIRAPQGKELVAADLASIETVTIAWLSNCTRLLHVFESGLDAYIDFATVLYSKPYGDVSKDERQKAKPAVLGCGFRLGGGELREGKRTGLWGYAEAMGVNLTKEESERAVRLFRERYAEIPKLWYALEKAVADAMRTTKAVVPVIRIGDKVHHVPVKIQRVKPYLIIWLPSGRGIYYYLPRINTEVRYGRPTQQYPDGAPYEKEVFSYMGKQQNGQKWTRIQSHGGKLTENIVQAVARDILAVGMERAHDDGFKIILHVHDELVAEVEKGSNYHTKSRLEQLMSDDIPWCPGMPLRAAGWCEPYYRKD